MTLMRRTVDAGYSPSDPWCLPLRPTRRLRGKRPCCTYLRNVASEKRMPRRVKKSTTWTEVMPSGCSFSMARRSRSESKTPSSPAPALVPTAAPRPPPRAPLPPPAPGPAPQLRRAVGVASRPGLAATRAVLASCRDARPTPAATFASSLAMPVWLRTALARSRVSRFALVLNVFYSMETVNTKVRRIAVFLATRLFRYRSRSKRPPRAPELPLAFAAALGQLRVDAPHRAGGPHAAPRRRTARARRDLRQHLPLRRVRRRDHGAARLRAVGAARLPEHPAARVRAHH